jgi:hypothetical protein
VKINVQQVLGEPEKSQNRYRHSEKTQNLFLADVITQQAGERATRSLPMFNHLIQALHMLRKIRGDRSS